MQLDDLKEAWTTHGEMLERSLTINERLLRETLLRKVRFALGPHILWRAVEVALGVAALVVVVPILVAHLDDPRYAFVAGGLALFLVGMAALSAGLVVKSLNLDYGGPVTTLQGDVERLKLLEYRAFKWALLGGVAIWLPLALVLFEALTGLDALARVHLGWLVGNIVLGLAALGLGHLLSRRYVERADAGPRAHRLVQALSGRSLRVATGHLEELARFEREDAPVDRR